MLASPDVRSGLVPFMTDDEIAVVTQRIDPVMAEYEAWCARWPLIRPDLLLVTAMHALVHRPQLSLPALMPYLKMSVWNVALDDAFDAPDADEADLKALINELNLAAAGLQIRVPRTPLTHGLEEIV